MQSRIRGLELVRDLQVYQSPGTRCHDVEPPSASAIDGYPVTSPARDAPVHALAHERRCHVAIAVHGDETAVAPERDDPRERAPRGLPQRLAAVAHAGGHIVGEHRAHEVLAVAGGGDC